MGRMTGYMDGVDALQKHTANFHGYKNDNFQLNFFDIQIFSQNIDCGYTLEPPQ